VLGAGWTNMLFFYLSPQQTKNIFNIYKGYGLNKISFSKSAIREKTLSEKYFTQI
jgi:hypothetical protein